MYKPVLLYQLYRFLIIIPVILTFVSTSMPSAACEVFPFCVIVTNSFFVFLFLDLVIEGSFLILLISVLVVFVRLAFVGVSVKSWRPSLSLLVPWSSLLLSAALSVIFLFLPLDFFTTTVKINVQ